MNIRLCFEVGAVLASPLPFWLVFRYLKEHAGALHEDMRKLITDSRLSLGKIVYGAQEDLNKTSLKDHGDTRLFVQGVSDHLEKVTSSMREEVKVLLKEGLAAVEADALKAKEEVLSEAAKAKEEILSSHKVLQKSLLSAHAAITSAEKNVSEAVLEASNSAARYAYKNAEEASSVANSMHTSTATNQQTLHDEIKGVLSTGLKSIEAATTKAKEEILEAHVVLHKSFISAATTIKAESAQATRERLDRPTPVVQCSVCKNDVVRYKTDADGIHLCANCQPKE